VEMTKAVRIHEHGGPEVLRYEEVEIGDPGPGEIRIRHTAIGLNFLDCYYRTGLYAAPNGLPLIPGNEAAGIVESVGEGVSDLKVGDQVAYGSRSEERRVGKERGGGVGRCARTKSRMERTRESG